MQGAVYSEERNSWTIALSSGEALSARYLVTAVGLLSKINYPDMPGLDSFKGEMYHSARWPSSYDFTGKHVGIIGNGSTGVQLITALADQPVKQLLSFQRHPQYVVPAGDAEVSPATREDLDSRWEEVWACVRASTFGFGFEESTKPTFSVSEEERERIFEEAWAKGGGFYFMFGTFCDIASNEEANKAAADFIRRKIRQKVIDPVKAEKLMPRGWHARRPLCDTGYYEKFNRGHVDVVDINTNPITRITEKGIETADGIEYELDVLVFATGFDAVDGNYKRMSIQGASNQSLKDRWSEEPSSFLGISIPGFPNLFSILGPNSPFTNLPPLIEVQVEFIADMIAHARATAATTTTGESTQGPRVEADPAAMQDWIRTCDKLSAGSLFRKTDSWIFGANVAGKTRSVLFYFGGIAMYRKVLQAIIDQGYAGFRLV
jgi:cation diffusion facilitator CzcD-associated flavoprotein CzcO